jgi:hypothetical protein
MVEALFRLSVSFSLPHPTHPGVMMAHDSILWGGLACSRGSKHHEGVPREYANNISSPETDSQTIFAFILQKIYHIEIGK